MIVALLVISLAMIVGGSAAALYGWDIVLNERGWTMVIAGTIVASGGAVLAGLAAVAARLGRIHRDVSALAERVGRGAIPPAPALDPLSALSPGLLAGAPAPGAPEPSPAQDEAQPSLPLFMQEPKDEPVGNLPPGLGPLPPGGPGALEPAGAEDEASRDDREESAAPPRPARPVIRVVERPPGAGTDPDRDGPAGERPSEAPPEETGPPAPKEEGEREAGEPSEPPTVIGTYNSGDNRYVMFSDGSIEAQTPNGMFRFGSLDELKEFIAAGGEKPSS